MRYDFGTPLNITELNRPLKGCIITENVYDGVTVYSMAANTDISAETYAAYRVFFVMEGSINVVSKCHEGIRESWEVKHPLAIIVPKDEPVAVTALEDSVFIEVILGTRLLNETVKPGEVFFCRDLVPYREGQMVKMDIINSGFMKFAILTFDQKCRMEERTAPGEAIITALEGQAIVKYEGEDIVLKAGEVIRIAKDAKHSIRTEDSRFKMSVLLYLSD